MVFLTAVHDSGPGAQSCPNQRGFVRVVIFARGSLVPRSGRQSICMIGRGGRNFTQGQKEGGGQEYEAGTESLVTQFFGWLGLRGNLQRSAPHVRLYQVPSC